MIDRFDVAVLGGGLVGSADRSGQQIEVIALEGEGIDNALAVSSQGVFIASNHAMYRFNRAADGKPQVDWRETYDRGSAPKPGTMGHGTGTTPTLLGEDFVAITDHARKMRDINISIDVLSWRSSHDVTFVAAVCPIQTRR